MATLGAIGQQLGLGDLGTIGSIVMAMASDPHMLLAVASMVPGLGSLAAAMDMALYLYEGDSFNAALAAAALIPGGAMLAVGVGKGAKALFTMARAGAKDLGAAVKASRIFGGLARAGGAVSRVVRSVRTRISRLIGKGDELVEVTTSKAPGRWKVGDPVDQLTAAGNKPSWSTVQSRVWKNEAHANPGDYLPQDLARMSKGGAPLHPTINVPKELHHIKPRREGGPDSLDNLLPVWPWEHADKDPFRHYNGPRP